MPAFNPTASKPTTAFNVPIYGQLSRYCLSGGTSVPYFNAVLPIERVVSELMTHEQVTPALEATYNLRELYQREIDEDRVEKEIVDAYLRDEQKLKFFNSLTIVLFPRDVNGRQEDRFTDYDGNNPAIPWSAESELDKNFASVSTKVFGGVQLSYAEEDQSFARLRWDRHRVEAVAVDGQHRLYALQKWFENVKKKSLSQDEKSTCVPVIFLLLDARAGFTTVGKSTGSLRVVAREIFTDLNKNAKIVDKAREIILDDRSLAALCVRELVTDSTCMDERGRLPLSLVRWKEANARFDQSYYLNSLIHLFLLLEDILGLSGPGDAMDWQEVKAYIQGLNATLGSGEPTPELQLDGVRLTTYVEQRYLDSDENMLVPLSGIPPLYIPAALEGFRLRYRGWLVRLLTEFRPYAALLKFARENNLILGPFAQWHAQPESHQNTLRASMEKAHGLDWKAKHIDNHVNAIASLKSSNVADRGDDWSFKAIFQKALVRLAARIVLQPDAEKERLGDIDALLYIFNRLHEAGVFDSMVKLADEPMRLWTLIALNPGNEKIKVSRKIEQTIEALLTVWYASIRLSLYSKKPIRTASEEGCLTAEDVIAFLLHKDNQAEWPFADDVALIDDTFRAGAHWFLGKERGEVSDQQRKKTAKRRLRSIVEFGLRPFMEGYKPSPPGAADKPQDKTEQAASEAEEDEDELKV